MEIKIGIQHASRELVLETDESAETVEKKVGKAVGDGDLLSLRDTKGRLVLVPADKLAYVEIAESEQRRVGFGAM